MTCRARGWALAVAMMGTASCRAAAPSAPSPGSILPLTAGLYLLSFSGFDLSNDPTLPPCTPLGVPREGKRVHAFVQVAPAGQEWTARLVTGAPGDLELSLGALGFRRMGGEAVSGRVRGTARDVSVPAFLWTGTDVSISLTGDSSPFAGLEGNTSGSSAITGGRISGVIRFTNTAGETATCSVVTWLLQPYGS